MNEPHCRVDRSRVVMKECEKDDLQGEEQDFDVNQLWESSLGMNPAGKGWETVQTGDRVVFLRYGGYRFTSVGLSGQGGEE
ncbi:hypothetical protein [Amycolatopsis sp. cmx-11-32]|uniref:hypothetical protein n=1 Tax=Amycolatopsis sp. cmx-11-32 TaxID=2785796 RepID=UPI0039E2F506